MTPLGSGLSKMPQAFVSCPFTRLFAMGRKLRLYSGIENA